MRILVAGATGFLGGRIAQYLSAKKHQIIIGARNQIPKPVWLADAEVVKLPWNDLNHIRKICNGVDIVINAAGMNAKACIKDPIAAYDFNGLATGRLINAAASVNVKEFIYISTAHVYSSPLVGLISEESPTENLHPYATSHLAGEKYLEDACKKSGMKGTVLRLSNAYGVPVDDRADCWGLLVNDLCRQIAKTNILTLKSDGRDQRDFISIKSLLSMLEKILTSNIEREVFEIYNIGTGKSKSVLEMAELIQDRHHHLFGYRPSISKLAEEGSTESSLIFCCEKIKKIVQAIPDNEIEEIDDLLIYSKNQFSRP